MSIFSIQTFKNSVKPLLSKLMSSVCMFTVLYACAPDESKKTEQTVEKTYADLLNSYEQIDFDSLLVYPVSGESAKHKFKGTELDSALLKLFPANYNAVGRQGEFFSCYKFTIDNKRTGLITRLPGEYESSRIELFVYNSDVDSIEQSLMLADELGDAGSVYVRNSVLAHSPNSLQFIVEDYNSEDHSVYDEADSTVTEESNFSLLKLGKTGADTISKNDSIVIRSYLSYCKRNRLANQ